MDSYIYVSLTVPFGTALYHQLSHLGQFSPAAKPGLPCESCNMQRTPRNANCPSRACNLELPITTNYLARSRSEKLIFVAGPVAPPGCMQLMGATDAGRLGPCSPVWGHPAPVCGGGKAGFRMNISTVGPKNVSGPTSGAAKPLLGNHLASGGQPLIVSTKTQ